MNGDNLLSRIADTLGSELAAMGRLEIAIAALCLLALVYAYAHLAVISRREARQQRLAALKPKQPRQRSDTGVALDLARFEPRRWYQRLGAIVASSPVIGSGDRARLTRLLSDAGLRGGKYRLASFIAIKICICAVAVAAIWTGMGIYGWFAGPAMLRFVAVLGAALIGWRAPDLALGQIARARRHRIERAFPDALDLLVISAEAGLSLDHGIDFVAREIGPLAAALGAEFTLASAELRVLGDRRLALQHFAERVNLSSVRSVVSTLGQTMRYGTPLAQSLRLLAAEMRSARLLRLEERAARMPVLLTLPLMTLILPSLILVVAGPAILRMIDALGALK